LAQKFPSVRHQCRASNPFSQDEKGSGCDAEKPRHEQIRALGGKDNFAADRAVADQALAAWPAMRISTRENRKFIGRAVRYLAGEAGIDQFLDIGSGLPTVANVHEVAQAINPAARVVYVDNDPLVLTHARALLTSSAEGKCAYIQADLREPKKILSDPVTQETLDFTRPIGLILAAVVHFLVPEDEPKRIITALLDALPPGSYVVASHGSTEYMVGDETAKRVVGAYGQGGIPLADRDSSQFAALAFSGLELVPPGVVVTTDWRPDSGAHRPPPSEVSTNTGVARKR
jgi:O-methyltransferase involved in polyketide biosynthesis